MWGFRKEGAKVPTTCHYTLSQTNVNIHTSLWQGTTGLGFRVIFIRHFGVLPC